MAVQFSVAVRNARLDAIETTIGTSPIFELRTGTQPADCATASTGNILVQQSLPSDWMQAAAAGAKVKSAAAWSSTAVGGAASTAGYGRIYVSGSPSECHIQWDVSDDMTVDGTITAGQTVTISTFTLTDGNA
jgi:hypothetical protein